MLRVHLFKSQKKKKKANPLDPSKSKSKSKRLATFNTNRSQNSIDITKVSLLKRVFRTLTWLLKNAINFLLPLPWKLLEVKNTLLKSSIDGAIERARASREGKEKKKKKREIQKLFPVHV